MVEFTLSQLREISRGDDEGELVTKLTKGVNRFMLEFINVKFLDTAFLNSRGGAASLLCPWGRVVRLVSLRKGQHSLVGVAGVRRWWSLYQFSFLGIGGLDGDETLRTAVMIP